jgi:hypothetical protein
VVSADGFGEGILWTLAGYERGQRFYESTGWQRDGGVRDDGDQVSFRHSLGRDQMRCSKEIGAALVLGAGSG